MTYLIVGNNLENIQKEIDSLVSKILGRDIDIYDENPDIYILDGREKNSIGIDEIKESIQKLKFTPFKEKAQILVVFNAEKITEEGQNSMLKSLEESSDTTVFILVVESEKKLLNTILSRCRKIYTKESKKVNSFDGVEEFFNMDIVDAFGYLENLSKEKSDTINFLDGVETYLQEKLESSIKNGLDIGTHTENISVVRIARRRIEANGNKKLALENMYIHLKRGV